MKCFAIVCILRVFLLTTSFWVGRMTPSSDTKVWEWAPPIMTCEATPTSLEPRPPDPVPMQWQEKTRDNFLRHFPNSTKHRLSRTKLRLQGTEPATVTPSESTTHLRDHVVFTESPVAPGVPVVARPPEDKAVNPERLNLDRKHLMVCPILEGEERLRLLNLQHNSIGRLQHLNNLRRLVFLDLYDNLVQEITGLDSLVSLRVLMLGRNRCVHVTCTCMCMCM